MIIQAQLHDDLLNRRLHCHDCALFLEQERHHIRLPKNVREWTIHLGDNLLFDANGLQLIINALQTYKGKASEIHFSLHMPQETWRDYYSISYKENDIILPIVAKRHYPISSIDHINISLPFVGTDIPFPASLCPSSRNCTPSALLFPYRYAHDLLFANQIVLFSKLSRAVSRAPLTWIKACFSRRKFSLKQRCALAFNHIDPSADIHPSAIVEGSWIGPHTRVGAHCVVRFSHLGSHVHLHDGAKVEYSQVDDHTWLMHDLVLYRSLCEEHVFLIHGPYQFSYFQKESAAFACIMMDYRPDHQAIKVQTPDGIMSYQGPFLGALLKDGSKAFGGSMLAPGVILDAHCNASADPQSILRQKDLNNLRQHPLKTT